MPDNTKLKGTGEQYLRMLVENILKNELDREPTESETETCIEKTTHLMQNMKEQTRTIVRRTIAEYGFDKNHVIRNLLRKCYPHLEDDDILYNMRIRIPYVCMGCKQNRIYKYNVPYTVKMTAEFLQKEFDEMPNPIIDLIQIYPEKWDEPDACAKLMTTEQFVLPSAITKYTDESIKQFFSAIVHLHQPPEQSETRPWTDITKINVKILMQYGVLHVNRLPRY